MNRTVFNCTLSENIDEAYFEFLIYGLMLNIIGVLGIFGNIISMIILSRPQMKSSINYLLIGLAKCDTILILTSILLFGLPGIYPYTGCLFTYYYNIYPHMVPILYPIATIAQTASVYLTMTVTLERFVAVCHPLRARSLCTYGRARIYVLAIAVFAILYNLPRFWEMSHHSTYIKTLNTTIYCVEATDLRMNNTYIAVYIHWLYLVFLYFLPFVSLAVLNMAIYRQIRKANVERQRLSRLQKREIGLATMLLFVLSSVSANVRSEVDSCKFAGAFVASKPCATMCGGASGGGEVEYLQGDSTVQSEVAAAAAAVSFVLATNNAVSEQCSEPVEVYANTVLASAACNEDQIQVINSNTENNKMVRDSVLLMHASVAAKTMIANGECCGAGEESDSSEELQYGPGIVNKLKSKYLSLTLRDTTAKPRPTILNMRRATSLENMLDVDSTADDLMADHNLNVDDGGAEFEETSTAMDVRCVSDAVTTNSRRYISRNGDRNSATVRNMQNRYRNTIRGNDSMKRARSVETLSRRESTVIGSDKEGSVNSTGRIHRDNTKSTAHNCDVKSFTTHHTTSTTSSGQRVVNRPKRVTSIMDETERPRADLVKQTLMLFEGPPVQRTRQPRPTGDVATKVATFRHIIESDKQKGSVVKKPVVATKPQITARPVLTQTEKNKTRSVAELTEGEKNKTRSVAELTQTVKNKTHSVAELPQTEKNKTQSVADEVSKGEEELVSPEAAVRTDLIPDVSRIAEVCDVSNLNVTMGRLRLSETPDLIVHSTSAHIHSPTAIKQITTEFLKNETVNGSEFSSKSGPSPKQHTKSDEMVDGDSAREITKQAVENIAKAGTSVTYSFVDTANKSHLPRLNTVPVCITRLIPDTPSNKPSPTVQQGHLLKKSRPAEVNGIITRSTSPLPSSVKEHKCTIAQSPKVEHTVSSSTANVPKTTVRPPPAPPTTTTTTAAAAVPLQNKTLTTRELEKNSINKLKTLEQPVSKVVVSVRNVDDVVVVVNKNLTGLLNKTGTKPNRTQEQTTILFNFQTRDTIPDYIATDGSSNVRRGKREKPKPGESGIILLPGAPVEEFRTDDEEDWMLSLNGPPSPCDVSFENDNVLIHGRSSISKQPKRQKMHIQFDDRSTQLFEYPSEASMLEEVVSPAFNTSPAPSGGHPVLMMPGSSLASYTPSKMSVASDFQLGVTRSTQPAPVVTAPSLATSSTAPLLEAGPQVQEPDQPLTYSAETTADILF
ncbi:FMRFamide Receptor [Carabus blaptoides fortunei]